MKKIITLLFVTLMAMTSASFAATLTSMNKAQVEQTFVDKTLTSVPSTRLNGVIVDNTFMVYLDAKGQIAGKFLNAPTDAPQTDTGTYKIADNGTMHVTWKHWEAPKEICVNFFDTHNAILAIGCDNEFHTVFMKKMIKSGDHLK